MQSSAERLEPCRVKIYLLIALGSGLGGVARHWMTGMVSTRFAGSTFPWGTFAVNVIGSLLIGVVAAVPQSRLNESQRLFLATGLMGGFTTFSAFSLQSLTLMQSGKLAASAAYIVASVLFCVAGCALGWWIGRQIA